MLLKDKFPELEKWFSNINEIDFFSQEYSSNEKFLWTTCERDHVLYKTALEIQRYPTCQTCKIIDSTNLDYQDTVAFLYPEIACLFSQLSPLAPDGLRPDSRATTVKWIDTEEKISVHDRVLNLIQSGKVERRHRSRKRISNDSSHKIVGSKKLFIDSCPEYYSWLLGEEKDSLSIGSSKKVSWRCDKGHEFSSSVRDFVKRTHKCPVCSGIVCISGVNDISTLYPNYAQAILSPSPGKITLSYSKKVTLQCHICKHVWQAHINKKNVSSSSSIGCPVCRGTVVKKGFNDLKTHCPGVVDLWDEDNIYQPDELTYGSEKEIILSCCQIGCDNKIRTYPYVVSRNNHRTCLVCSTCASSAGERELIGFIAGLGVEIIEHDRKILSGKELDIFLPQKNIALEFNGLFYHSEARIKDKNYHYNKWRGCADQGIQLITIWEDDWEYNQDLIKNMVSYKLGASCNKKIMARKTQVRKISQDKAKNFLNRNHIQGFSPGCYHYGLCQDDELVAVMSFQFREGIITISRYATSYIVTGGFSKLLSKIPILFPQAQLIQTFSDNTVSMGKLYSSHGFCKKEELPPDYSYLYKGKRHHKFNFRKSRFYSDPNLRFIEGLTELELAKENGLHRIWDAGKVRWVKCL